MGSPWGHRGVPRLQNPPGLLSVTPLGVKTLERPSPRVLGWPQSCWFLVAHGLTCSWISTFLRYIFLCLWLLEKVLITLAELDFLSESPCFLLAQPGLGEEREASGETFSAKAIINRKTLGLPPPPPTFNHILKLVQCVSPVSFLSDVIPQEPKYSSKQS